MAKAKPIVDTEAVQPEAPTSGGEERLMEPVAQPQAVVTGPAPVAVDRSVLEAMLAELPEGSKAQIVGNAIRVDL